jgi:hypothetical protein
MTTSRTTLVGERADLVAALDRHRGFLLQTVRGITDDQARQRTTVSALTLGGLIKHVAITEDMWLRFASGGADAMSGGSADAGGWEDGHVMRPDETLAGLLAKFDASLGGRTSTWRPPTSTSRTRCRPRRGSSRVRSGRSGGCCCTCWPRCPSTPGTPTSSGRHWTGRRPWVDSSPAGPDRRTVGSADSIGRGERWVRRAYRLRSRLLCRIGAHRWTLRRNPEVGGRDALYEDCRRCGRERNTYDPRDQGAVWGARRRR